MLVNNWGQFGLHNAFSFITPIQSNLGMLGKHIDNILILLVPTLRFFKTKVNW